MLTSDNQWLQQSEHKIQIFLQSPTQWPHLTHRIDLCAPLAVCKTQLCSRFCLLEAVFLTSYVVT